MGMEQHPSQYRGTDDTTTAEPTIADECEAFLRGSFVTFSLRHGRGTDAWMALNRVAHGSATTIHLLADGIAAPSPWLADEQAVARALVSLTETDAELESLQHTALVPLELWLAGDALGLGMSGRGVLGLAADALDAHAGLPRPEPA